MTGPLRGGPGPGYPRAWFLIGGSPVWGQCAPLWPAVTRRLVERFVKRPSPETTGQVDQLTEREREVLGHVARGLWNAEIAADLYLSEATIKIHVTRILPKLGLRDRVQAVVFAYETGLVEPGEAR